MEITKAIELLHYDVKGQIEGKLRIVPIMRGNPGIGKTATLKKLAESLNCHLYYVSLGSKALEYYSGIPDIIHQNGDSYAKWSMPELIFEVNELAKSKSVIILLDDIHVMDFNAQKYMFELLLERSLHQNFLAPNVAIVASANTSDKSGWEGFYAAIINRFKFYDVSFSYDTWMKEFGYSINSIVTSFMRANPDFINQEERIDQPFATPRAWTELANYISLLPHDLLKQRVMEIAQSYVSSEAALAFSTFYKTVIEIDLAGKLNRRELKLDDNLSAPQQIMYGMAIRYAGNNSDIDFLFNLLDLNYQKYPNFTHSIALEALSLSKSKNELAIKFIKKIATKPDLMKSISSIFI
jgi:MoxR-like ATPase